MGKVDTTGIEFLEGDFGVGRAARPKLAKKALKPAVRAKSNPFQGVSSWAILRELLSRHYVDLQVVGFWIVLAVIIYVKLGR